jgi:putative phage-type endonuclease
MLPSSMKFVNGLIWKTTMTEQRTEAWFLQRLGKATGSRIADIIAKTKSGYSASRENYQAQLVVERLTNKPTEGFTNSAMQWGTDTEPLARAAYEMARDVMVEEIGFIDHPIVYMSGASPDGFVGEDGLIEIKCPNTATHIDTLLTQTIPAKYIPQIQWQLSCTNRKWCDFVSFDPRMPENLQLYIQRVEFHPEYVEMLIKEVSVFLDEVEKKVNILRNIDVKNSL